jgi:hypothetical protein
LSWLALIDVKKTDEGTVMKPSSVFAAIVSSVLLAWGSSSSAGSDATPAALTFFGWSDQHVQTNGDATHLIPAIDTMNTLPGTKYPDRFSGQVDKPVFVFGCGDITEWPTTAAKNSYQKLLGKRLKFPAYDMLGNHDEGGNVPSDTLKRWIIARHGSLSYTFDRAGIHFVALFSKYDESLNSPTQPVSRDALGFLREDLANQAKTRPVVVALHLCFDAITNRDELVDAFGDANVILVLGGHYHKAKVDRFRGVNFVQLPSPAPNGQREIMVIRIGAERLIAIPYNYEKQEWSDSAGKTLDAPIKRIEQRQGLSGATRR